MTYYLATPAPETIDLGFVQLGWFKVLILGIVQGITERSEERRVGKECW